MLKTLEAANHLAELFALTQIRDGALKSLGRQAQQLRCKTNMNLIKCSSQPLAIHCCRIELSVLTARRIHHDGSTASRIYHRLSLHTDISSTDNKALKTVTVSAHHQEGIGRYRIENLALFDLYCKSIWRGRYRLRQLI